MEINDFVGIGIVGAGVSVLIEWVTVKFATRPNMSKAIAIGLSVLIGSVYFFIRETPYFPTVVGILAMASTVYALFLNK